MTTELELVHREKFEAWAEECCALPWGYLKKRRTYSGHYSEHTYTSLWGAWKAACGGLVEALEAAEQNSDGVAGMAEHYETTISMLRSRIAELEASHSKLRETLAAMDVEPIVYMNRFTGRAFELEEQPGVDKDPAVYMPLYAAPPAPPAPPAPDAYIRDEHRRMMLNGKCEPKIGFAAGWNACRAAMLQGAENAGSRCTIQAAPALDYSPKNAESRSGNSPVIPKGWVACSERMPDRDYVLAADFSGKQYPANMPNIQIGIYADWFDDGSPCWDDGDGNDLHLKQVTHWTQIPAAPQQE